MQHIPRTTRHHLCRTCSLQYHSFLIPLRTTTGVHSKTPWSSRSYSQSQHHENPHESSPTNTNNNNNNNKTNHNPLDNVLDRELDAFIKKNANKKEQQQSLVQSSSARDLQSILKSLWPESECGPIQKASITVPPPPPTTAFQPQDPNVAKKTQRIQSQIEKQLLNMVRKSQQPHKKTSPLPRGMLGSFYGKSVFQKSRRRMDEPAIIVKTHDENIMSRDKETNAINSLLECTTGRQLLERVINFTTSTDRKENDDSNYPPYYAKLLTHAIKKASVTFQDPYLALSIFEHAKTHSVMSYVAGCTTEVYNALLMMRWQLWQDVHGMLHLVDEMMVNGVHYDYETRCIVQMVVSEVENDRRLDDPEEQRSEEDWDTEDLDLDIESNRIKDGMVWSMDERRSANIMKALVGKWLIK
ncbi:hypothetical protein BDA99DRAFT_69644 [Phascolomyces articulosus]|uniref:Mtf2-like C-terminal domain-containing protein n=1 Tax=Phascolomyces articulosus TaxID=60185 RepID=A0AAD5PDJ5_9FUNG|nr:hypothetical protein BDA99DRAFT_69644 [Phascolomyces articulosus]